MSPDEFQVAIQMLGWSKTKAAHWLDVDRSTIARWLASERRIPAGVARLMRLTVMFDLAKRTEKVSPGTAAAEFFARADRILGVSPSA